MQHVKKSMLVPYGAPAMFELVADVERYPLFLPWCVGARVLERHEGGTTATLDIDYHGVRAHFTTANLNDPPKSIVVTLKDGPFKHLHGEWHFRALDETACKIEFDLAWDFKNHMFERLVGGVFSRIANTMIDAFVHRAESLQGSAVERSQ